MPWRKRLIIVWSYDSHIWIFGSLPVMSLTFKHSTNGSTTSCLTSGRDRLLRYRSRMDLGVLLSAVESFDIRLFKRYRREDDKWENCLANFKDRFTFVGGAGQWLDTASPQINLKMCTAYMKHTSARSLGDNVHIPGGLDWPLYSWVEGW